MRAWHIVRSRLRSLVFRGGRESDLNEELQFHLEREAERLQVSGLSPEHARLQALRLFGGVEQVKEASRDARGTAAFDALARDTRDAVRRLVCDWRFRLPEREPAELLDGGHRRRPQHRHAESVP